MYGNPISASVRRRTQRTISESVSFDIRRCATVLTIGARATMFNVTGAAFDRNRGEGMMLIARNPLPALPIAAAESELGRMKDD